MAPAIQNFDIKYAPKLQKKNNNAPKAKITLLKTIGQDYAPENLNGAPKNPKLCP